MATSSFSTPWFVDRSMDAHRMRLYCFPYAGGGTASFQQWQAQCDPAIQVCPLQLPGRGARFGETPYSDWPSLIADLGQMLRSQGTLPFAFFGHSFGALVAFELTRYCQQHQLAMPQLLMVSGSAAPQNRGADRDLANLDDNALIESLKEYKGTPPEVLEHRELMELLLPTIRADFNLVSAYRYRPSHLLNIPITVFAGRQDTEIELEQVNAWQAETHRPATIYWCDGDHFFIHSERTKVLAHVNRQLHSMLCVS
jgi:surfactin synthase thioesterase subunit